MTPSNCFVLGCENELTVVKEMARLDVFDEYGEKVGSLPILTGWCEEHTLFSSVYAQYHALVNRAAAKDEEVKSLPQMSDVEMVAYQAQAVSVEEANEIQRQEEELRHDIEEAIRVRNEMLGRGETFPDE